MKYHIPTPKPPPYTVLISTDWLSQWSTYTKHTIATSDNTNNALQSPITQLGLIVTHLYYY